ncbi:MAG: hypothetical protein V4614_15090 [Pseudomonadota bacterium]
MNRFIVRIAGYRLTVTAPDVFDAINQVRSMFPFHTCGSARPA